MGKEEEREGRECGRRRRRRSEGAPKTRRGRQG